MCSINGDMWAVIKGQCQLIDIRETENYIDMKVHFTAEEYQSSISVFRHFTVFLFSATLYCFSTTFICRFKLFSVYGLLILTYYQSVIVVCGTLCERMLHYS